MPQRGQEPPDRDPRDQGRGEVRQRGQERPDRDQRGQSPRDPDGSGEELGGRDRRGEQWPGRDPRGEDRRGRDASGRGQDPRRQDSWQAWGPDPASRPARDRESGNREPGYRQREDRDDWDRRAGYGAGGNPGPGGGAAGYRELGDRGPRYADRDRPEPGYRRGDSSSERLYRDGEDTRSGAAGQRDEYDHAGQPPAGQPPPRRTRGRGGRGRNRWPSRSRLLLTVAAAAAVIGLGSWQLVAARAGSDSGHSKHSLAAAKSPKAGPSGAHASGGTSPAASAATFSLDWVGDMTFGSPGAWPPDGTGSLLTQVTGNLHSDLTMGNLESALGDLPMSKCAPGESDCYEFEAPDSTAQMLVQDGFSAVNVANNHTLDAGAAGEANTNTVLQQAGLLYAGRPGQITYLNRNGITIALLAFAPWSYDADALDIPAAEALVHQAAQHAQVVIVMEHLGAEGDGAQHVTDSEEYYLGQDRGNSVAFTHGVIDAGADLVVGSGPHVLRGFQWYKGHLIAYSLGNFCGYNTLGLDSITSVSAILHVTLGAQGQFVSGSITPLKLVEPGTPEPDPAGAAIATINSLSQDDFAGNGAAQISAAGIIEPPSASDG